MTFSQPSRGEINDRRRDARRRELAERILSAVEGLLSVEKFTALTVDQILAASGVSRTTFYRHFSDKTELLMAISEPVLDSINRAAMNAWRLDSDLTITRLERDIAETIEVYLPHVSLFSAMAEAATYDSRVQAQFRAGMDRVHGSLAARVADGQAAGYLRPDLSAWETAGWITWMAERGMSQLVTTATEQERKRLVESLARLVCYGLYRPDGEFGASPPES